MAKGLIPQELLTEKTWNEYLDNISGDSEYLGYLHANRHLVSWIDKKLETAKNFEELRNELLNLRNERQKFIDYGYANLP